ncbi:MAG TPA: hypothetical protein VG733_12490 [Chthoniobacteraceae bacterium]|nr:hypothetical protein [Chthoniobacteraceae bacterium]
MFQNFIGFLASGGFWADEDFEFVAPCDLFSANGGETESDCDLAWLSFVDKDLALVGKRAAGLNFDNLKHVAFAIPRHGDVSILFPILVPSTRLREKLDRLAGGILDEKFYA